ncbi:MAG: outer membrane lipoprotein chaperone LolA [Pseudomonadota bacterium]
MTGAETAVETDAETDLNTGAKATLGDAGSEPAAQLLEALERLDGSLANFEQTVLDGYGQVLEVTRGNLVLARPNVRWDVFEPFPQTIVLADGLLRIFDPDLEQVTERQVGDDWAQVPLALLSRQRLDISAYFHIEQLAHGTFRLQPLAAEALLEYLVLTFAATGLAQLRVVDHAGQVTQILFSDVVTGQVIESEVFQLKLPPEVEIVRG